MKGNTVSLYSMLIGWTVSDIIDHLDLGPLVETYDHRGAPAYHPLMMMKLIVYANLVGMRGSRRIEAALHDSLVFMYLSGRQTPDFHTICRFRREHGTRIEEVFDKVVGICAGLKMVGGRNVFCDGSKVKANASVSESKTREQIEKEEEKLKKEVKRILEEADREKRKRLESKHLQQEFYEFFVRLVSFSAPVV